VRRLLTSVADHICRRNRVGTVDRGAGERLPTPSTEASNGGGTDGLVVVGAVDCDGCVDRINPLRGTGWCVTANGHDEVFRETSAAV